MSNVRDNMNILFDLFNDIQDTTMRRHIGFCLRSLVKSHTRLNCDCGKVAKSSGNSSYYYGSKLTHEEVKLGQEEGKIHAIRAYRQRTGLGLYQSKVDVENIFTQFGLRFKDHSAY